MRAINVNEAVIANIGANLYRLERTARSARTVTLLMDCKAAFRILTDTANAIVEDTKFLDREFAHSLKNIVAKHTEQFEKNCKENPNNFEVRK